MSLIHHHHYVPAAGQHWLLPFYDPLVALFTRERHWRGAILDSLALQSNDVLVDVGCGTGSLAVLAKTRAPQARIIGIDPDPAALKRAEKKAARRGAAVEFRRGFGDQTSALLGGVQANKAVSSLALHHMPRDMQKKTVGAMFDTLAPGGAVRIADFVGGHFHGPAESDLAGDLAAAGFDNTRTIGRFRLLFSDVILVGAEKPRR